ncbi:MAG: HRDC domain-containing protein, partial [Chloroflexi bacterium]|nr:HRDC domain-containing protein [Chloroflexota bacterium]
VVAEWERDHPDATPAPPMPRAASSNRGGTAAVTDSALRDADAYVDPDDPLYQTLRAWRMERALAESSPAYTVFSDRTLRELVRTRPRNVHSLLQVWGLGEARVERFGADLVQVIRDHDGA